MRVFICVNPIHSESKLRAHRKFEQGILKGLTPDEILTSDKEISSHLTLTKARLKAETLASSELGGYIKKNWSERISESITTLIIFYVNHIERIKNEIGIMQKAREECENDLDLLKSRESLTSRIQSLMKDQAFYEERLSAIKSMQPPHHIAKQEVKKSIEG